MPFLRDRSELHSSWQLAGRWSGRGQIGTVLGGGGTCEGVCGDSVRVCVGTCEGVCGDSVRVCVGTV